MRFLMQNVPKGNFVFRRSARIHLTKMCTDAFTPKKYIVLNYDNSTTCAKRMGTEIHHSKFDWENIEFIENARLCPWSCPQAVRVRWRFIVKKKWKNERNEILTILEDYEWQSPSSFWIVTKYSKSQCSLGPLWKSTYTRQPMRCEHCAPYQYNSRMQTLGVASDKSIVNYYLRLKNV